MIWCSLNLLFRIEASSRHSRSETSSFQWLRFKGRLQGASIAAEFLLGKKGVIDKNVRWESYTTVEVKARVLKTARRQVGDAMNLAIARHQSEDGS
jgi:hypothetical protein